MHIANAEESIGALESQPVYSPLLSRKGYISLCLIKDTFLPRKAKVSWSCRFEVWKPEEWEQLVIVIYDNIQIDAENPGDQLERLYSISPEIADNKLIFANCQKVPLQLFWNSTSTNIGSQSEIWSDQHTHPTSICSTPYVWPSYNFTESDIVASRHALKLSARSRGRPTQKVNR